jgi:hypothetical protein
MHQQLKVFLGTASLIALSVAILSTGNKSPGHRLFDVDK